MSLALVCDPKTTYNPPNHKHDSGYKYLLSDKQVFLQLLQSFVQEEWVEQMTSDNVTRVDKSFILPDFQNREADLVYRITLADRDIIFYLLLELQATVDFTMPFRLLLYMVEIWRSFLLNKGKNITGKDFRLPVIVPCVLYKWKE
ncbi:MAG: Rpn family recombination-promoting nuclease/putative transposase [Firmicutes bacterium]|nr:Rpn family recombination-promoting nuclease/putative transposase [Bacillota bacterium]